jgi:hypothetical protein
MPTLCKRRKGWATRHPASFRFGAKEGPGFAVGVVEAGAAVAAATEQEAGDSASGVERDDVPGVFGDDVGGEEVDFAGKVRDGASVGTAVGVDAIESVAELGGTFDLDAPEWRGRIGRARIGLPAKVAGVDNDVVAFAVAVGLADSEAEFVGLEGEGDFGEFSKALGGEFSLAGRLRDGGSRGRLWGERGGLDGLVLDRLRVRR